MFGIVGITGIFGSTGMFGSSGTFVASGLFVFGNSSGSFGVLGISGIFGVFGIFGSTGIVDSLGLSGDWGVFGSVGSVGLFGSFGSVGSFGIFVSFFMHWILKSSGFWISSNFNVLLLYVYVLLSFEYIWSIRVNSYPWTTAYKYSLFFVLAILSSIRSRSTKIIFLLYLFQT